MKEHPDYLFGKLNLASEYFEKKEYDFLPQLLGPDFDLSALYPDRDTFHVTEFSGMQRLAIKYFMAKGNVEEAYARMGILREVAPDSYDTEDAENFMLRKSSEIISKRLKEENKHRISVKTKNADNDSHRTEAPVFNHPQVQDLYNYGIYIPEEKIKALLSLPKSTLIEDLHSVINDSIKRQQYFKKQIDEYEYEEEKTAFLIHAIYLLGELESKESLDVVLSALRESVEYIDMFLADLLTDTMWEPLYKISHNQLNKLSEFIREPGVYTYAKTEVAKVVEQLALHEPSRREEAINWFKDAFTFFSNCKADQNIIDTDMIALMICNVIDISADELIPEIEKLYELGYVGFGICGTLGDVKTDIKDPLTFDYKLEILGMIERYKYFTDQMDLEERHSGFFDHDDEDYEEFDDFDKYTTVNLEPVRTEPKIGRNDPCPCGSGKKYKKCCM